jgi:hypothetical protein
MKCRDLLPQDINRNDQPINRNVFACCIPYQGALLNAAEIVVKQIPEILLENR